MPKDCKKTPHASAPSATTSGEEMPFSQMPEGPIHSIDDLKYRLSAAESFRIRNNRPFITVTYAQSVDGSIATKNRQPIGLSGPESAILTHQIRACSDAILIGIGTLLADNPNLTVRLVKGGHPQPIILDTHLRTPLNTRLLRRQDVSPWIINGERIGNARQLSLINAGATIIACSTTADGKIDLQALMGILARRQINSVMVEGGAKVITSFVNLRLVDQLIITVAPRMIGGLAVIDSDQPQLNNALQFDSVSYQQLGADLVIWARPLWKY